MGSGSVAFDRAADSYDQTRALSRDAERATVRLLKAELAGHGRCLEVGVGTGLIALPLHRAGVSLAGLDISAPMVAKLVEKAGGRPPFPLIIADATRMPFAEGAFGAALFRHVLHLIPPWQDAVGEIARVVRPGGVALANLGKYGGPWDEMQVRFAGSVDVPVDPVGLDWEAWNDLDQVFVVHGARSRELPPILERSDEPLGRFIDGIERNLYSWTWPVPEEARLRAAAELRTWAEERFGPLDRPYRHDFTIEWRAYDLP